MNLNVIRPSSETENLLLSMTKNRKTFIKQTHTKPQETLEFKTTTPRERFSFKPPIHIEGSWMIGLTTLEVYNSIFNVTEEINIYELHTDTFDEFSFAHLKDGLEQIFSISDITTKHLRHEKIEPRTIQAYRKLTPENLSTDVYLIVLMSYSPSLF